MPAPAPSIHTFEFGDVRLVADQLGEPVFLLLHAGGERRKVWQPIAERLWQSGYGSLAVDQRGHGESGGTRGDGVARFAADAAEIIAGQSTPIIVVGASLGGFCGLLAATEPAARRNMRGLVLVDVIPDPDPDRVRAYLRTTTPPLDQSPLVDDILGQSEKLREASAGIDFPVLLVVAGEGSITDSDIKRLSEAVSELKVVRIEHASHLVARDKPYELAEVLLSFAKELPRLGAE
ncbi:alpha/beta fold hydrolase [Altererythrobacter sp. MF3-039]|uniref:alpha/beta fold hydrolase n=1 Tax=Altererythrobacter sp. MF3-039 TaxID=3252901 RepID=UPI00390CC53D